MSPSTHDPIVELRALDVPPPREGFWDDLHRLLLDVDVSAADDPKASPAHVADLSDAPSAGPRRRSPVLLLTLIAAAALLLVVAVAVVGGQRTGRIAAVDGAVPDPTDAVEATGSTQLAPSSAPSSATTAATGAPSPATTGAGSAGMVLARTLTPGASGDDVRTVQQRLSDLRFDPGPVDGVFGTYTQQAVWAFETMVLKTPLDQVIGEVTPEMWSAMQADVVVAPRRPSLTATHVEIYLPEQALVVFEGDEPALIAHISSGALAAPGTDFSRGADWCDEVSISPGEIGNENGTAPVLDGRCGNSVTPGGTYRFYRKVFGSRLSALGGMFDPTYFNYGIAVHGAAQVPLHPSSHGGVRINRYLGPIFQGLIGRLGKESGDQVYVWNGVEEPEEYGAQAGVFDSPDLAWRDAHRSSGG